MTALWGVYLAFAYWNIKFISPKSLAKLQQAGIKENNVWGGFWDGGAWISAYAGRWVSMSSEQCPPSNVFLASWGKPYLIVDQGQCEPVSNSKTLQRLLTVLNRTWTCKVLLGWVLDRYKGRNSILYHLKNKGRLWDSGSTKVKKFYYCPKESENFIQMQRNDKIHQQAVLYLRRRQGTIDFLGWFDRACFWIITPKKKPFRKYIHAFELWNTVCLQINKQGVAHPFPLLHVGCFLVSHQNVW